MPTAVVDLHCHSSASFDSKADVMALVRRAAELGITHLAITDHGTIDGALRARDQPTPGTQVIVGEEIRTTSGDMIALFIERAIADGMDIEDTVAAVRAQGGVIGLPHPFDTRRPSTGVHRSSTEMAHLATLVDYMEIVNGRLSDRSAMMRALAFAAEHGVAGIDASDAHTVVELGQATSTLFGNPGSADGLRASLQQRVAETRVQFERVGSPTRRLSRIRALVRSVTGRND